MTQNSEVNSRPDRMFVITVVHVYSAPNCSKYGVCSAVYGNVHMTQMSSHILEYSINSSENII